MIVPLTVEAEKRIIRVSEACYAEFSFVNSFRNRGSICWEVLFDSFAARSNPSIWQSVFSHYGQTQSAQSRGLSFGWSRRWALLLHPLRQELHFEFYHHQWNQ